MIDPATGWFKIKEIKTKKADVKVNVVEKTWITIYNWPNNIIMGRVREFMAEFADMIEMTMVLR